MKIPKMDKLFLILTMYKWCYVEKIMSMIELKMTQFQNK